MRMGLGAVGVGLGTWNPDCEAESSDGHPATTVVIRILAIPQGVDLSTLPTFGYRSPCFNSELPAQGLNPRPFGKSLRTKHNKRGSARDSDYSHLL